MKILVVEDERKLRSLIVKGLKAEGFSVDQTDSGDEALHLVDSGNYDALVLDIMLSGRDGLSVLKEIRGKGLRTPVIITTARDAHDDRLLGLNSGADDYVVKPFFVDELVARLKAIWRRTVGLGMERLKVEDLVVNLMDRTVRRGERKIELQPREFNLLVFLMQSPERIVTRVQIFEKVWDYHFDPESNLADVYIGRLRRKINSNGEAPLIQTMRNVGYRLVPSKES